MIFLKKIGIKNNDRCAFCEVQLENLHHLFWFCTITSSFWQKFKQWLINDKNFATIQDTNLTFSIIIGLRPSAFKTKTIDLFSFNRKIFHLDLSSTKQGPQYRIFLFLRNLPRCFVNCLLRLFLLSTLNYIKKPPVS